MKSRPIELSTANRVESIILPINPPNIVLNMGQKNQTIDLLALGEVLTLGNRSLAALTLDSFFPARHSPFFRYAERLPWDYYNLLNRWKTSKTVLRLIVGGSPINMAVAIEKLSCEVREGDNDLYYKLELKEYRRLNVPTQQHSNVRQDNGLLDRPDISEKPMRHIVRSTDETFWYIACKYYGDGTKWKAIADANGRELAYDVFIGDSLVLP